MDGPVDDEREARRALVENFTSAFEAIARDVKIQVELNPNAVERYRLLGYENRAIADRDFRNDAVDAGEVGAGHQVTALYELELGSAANSNTLEGALATVRLRWKPPYEADLPAGTDPEKATEIAHEVRLATAAGSFDATSAGYRRSVIVAQFAELLRRSVHARGDSLDELIAEAKKLEEELGEVEFSELVELLQRSRDAILQRLPRTDELTLALDELRERRILIARLESLRAEEAERRSEEERELVERMRSENAELEARIRELIESRLRR